MTERVIKVDFRNAALLQLELLRIQTHAATKRDVVQHALETYQAVLPYLFKDGTLHVCMGDCISQLQIS